MRSRRKEILSANDTEGYTAISLSESLRQNPEAPMTPSECLKAILFVSTMLVTSYIIATTASKVLPHRRRGSPLRCPGDIMHWFRCEEDSREQALQCYVRAIQKSSPLIETYNNIVAGLLEGSRMAARLSSVECHMHAVELITHVQKAWYSVGQSLHQTNQRVTVDHKEYLQSDCYVSYLRLEPEISNAWLMLGKEKTLHYGETKVQRLVSGSRGGLETDFEVVDALRCFFWALHYNPMNSLAWYHLALLAFPPPPTESRWEFEWGTFPPSRTDPTVTVNGKNYTLQQCLVEALRMHSRPLAVPRDAWSMLANTLRGGETIAVGDDQYTKNDLIELAQK